MEKKFLLPGEFHSTKRPMLLSTLLGSCVSVCLYNKINGFAALNHFMLATGSAEDMKKDVGKYGVSSTTRIIRSLMTIDADSANYTAQIFGGGHVTKSHLEFQNGIGDQNIKIAEDILRKYRIKVIHKDVAGSKGRKIFFDTSTNIVASRFIGDTKEGQRLSAIRKDISSRDLKILIVDDSATVRNLLSMAVSQSQGMIVIGQAENPYEAREKILECDPDVILLDIIMPKMDGLKFLKRLSASFPKPVVICSTIAKAGSNIAKQAAAYGAMEVIDKEKLELYKGMDVVLAELIPKIRSAFRNFTGKKIPLKN